MAVEGTEEKEVVGEKEKEKEKVRTKEEGSVSVGAGLGSAGTVLNADTPTQRLATIFVTEGAGKETLASTSTTLLLTVSILLMKMERAMGVMVVCD